MNLSFHCHNDGKMKIDDKGNKTIALKMDDIDVEKLNYFHLRPDTSLHIQGNLKDLNCSGFIKEIVIKSKITVLFVVESESVDLNLMYQLCRDPEPWEVRISDAQEELGKYASIVAQYIKSSNKEDLVKKILSAGVDPLYLVDMADELIEKFGQEGAKEIVKMVREAKNPAVIQMTLGQKEKEVLQEASEKLKSGE